MQEVKVRNILSTRIDDMSSVQYYTIIFRLDQIKDQYVRLNCIKYTLGNILGAYIKSVYCAQAVTLINIWSLAPFFPFLSQA